MWSGHCSGSFFLHVVPVTLFSCICLENMFPVSLAFVLVLVLVCMLSSIYVKCKNATSEKRKNVV